MIILEVRVIVVNLFLVLVGPKIIALRFVVGVKFVYGFWYLLALLCMRVIMPFSLKFGWLICWCEIVVNFIMHERCTLL